MTGTSWWTEKAGFRKGDIVAAVDGYQVSNRDQYRILFDRSFEDLVKVTVWRVDRYIDLTFPLRQYYGPDVANYTRTAYD